MDQLLQIPRGAGLFRAYTSCGGRLRILRPVNIADVKLPPSCISVHNTSRCGSSRETVNAGTFIYPLVEIALEVRTR